MATTDDRRLARFVFLLTIPIALVSCGLWLDDEARIERARVALDNQQYSAAIIDLKNVLRNTPDSAVARKLLGLALAANGDPDGAEKELQLALDLGQPLAEFRVALVQARLATGQPEQALHIADPAAAADDAQAFRLWLYRGDAQADLDEVADALRSYEQAGALNIDKATAMLRAVEIYWGAGNLGDAKTFTESALLNDPGNVDAHLTLGEILLEMGDPQAAEETLTNALSVLWLDPEDRGYLLESLTDAHLAQGDVGAARKTSDQVAGGSTRIPSSSR